MLVIVPNDVSDLINARLDAAIAGVPDAAKDRDNLYRQLLTYFDQHGRVPSAEEITVVKTKGE